jgi:hypothetical protein
MSGAADFFNPNYKPGPDDFPNPLHGYSTGFDAHPTLHHIEGGLAGGAADAHKAAAAAAHAAPTLFFILADIALLAAGIWVLSWVWKRHLNKRRTLS